MSDLVEKTARAICKSSCIYSLNSELYNDKLAEEFSDEAKAAISVIFDELIKEADKQSKDTMSCPQCGWGEVAAMWLEQQKEKL